MRARTDAPDAIAARRVAGVDWKRVESRVGAMGWAKLPGLLTAAECRTLRGYWADEERFRKQIDLEQHRFGKGEYRYFAYPLPPLVAALRTALYPPLAHIANGWQEALGETERFPRSHRSFLAHCRSHEQVRPTPLLLHYGAGGYNRMHQDLYGEVAFPLQIACLLSRPGRDFEGGEFLLVEQRPRMQSRGEAIPLQLGEAVVFANRDRPVEGTRGVYRASLRHGVSTIHSGERFTLGIIFHDAR